MSSDRYSRQKLYKNIKVEGQKKISQSTVLILGLGALGSVSSEMLARAGVKKLILIDRDFVELSNLQRQSLYTEKDAEGIPKVVAAKKYLNKVRSDLLIDIYVEHCDAVLLDELVESVDLIMDGTDNFATRLVINDVAYKHNIPWVSAAVVEDTYNAVSFNNASACYRCLVPNLPSNTLTCDTAGVIAPAVNIAVSHQVTLALQLLMGDVSEVGRQRMGNVWDASHICIQTAALKRPNCPTCGENPVYPSFDESEEKYQALCGRDTVQLINYKSFEDVLQFVQKRNIDYVENPYYLSFEYNNYRINVFKNGRILIYGTNDITRAKIIVNQLFG